MMKGDFDCPKCGQKMHEERSQARTYRGKTERLWRCDNCLHEERTTERAKSGRYNFG